MKIKSLLFLALILSVSVISSCNMSKQASGAYNLVNCEYDYNSVSDVEFADMDFSKGVSVGNALKVTSILTGRSKAVPFGFTINLDVTNPNQSAAMFSGLHYILAIDGVEFTRGSVAQKFDVPAGGKSSMPISIGMDLATLLGGDSRDAASNAVMNFIGMGDSESNVSFKIKPSFSIANRSVPAPVYIPVNFSYGGGK